MFAEIANNTAAGEELTRFFEAGTRITSAFGCESYRVGALIAVAASGCADRPTSGRPLGRNQLNRGKVGAVTLDVAREQRAGCDRGMRANEEV